MGLIKRPSCVVERPNIIVNLILRSIPQLFLVYNRYHYSNTDGTPFSLRPNHRRRLHGTPRRVYSIIMTLMILHFAGQRFHFIFIRNVIMPHRWCGYDFKDIRLWPRGFHPGTRLRHSTVHGGPITSTESMIPGWYKAQTIRIMYNTNLVFCPNSRAAKVYYGMSKYKATTIIIAKDVSIYIKDFSHTVIYFACPAIGTDY